MKRRRTLLFILAHPDDESFLAAGICCRYNEQGVDLVLVTATGGEAGKRGDPPVCEPEDLGDLRLQELASAAELLGIRTVLPLGYRDKELAAAPPDRIREQLVGIVRAHRPDVVVTFDPNGTNLHTDHVAVSRFTTDALAAAADPRWFPAHGAPFSAPRLLWTPPLPVWEAARVPDLPALPGIDFRIDITEWREQKRAALKAHRSQHISIDRVFFSQPDVDKLLSVETFRQAWGPALPRTPSGDLFEGM